MNAEGRVATGGQRQHRGAMAAGGQLQRLLVRGNRRRHEEDAVEPGLLPTALGDDEMAEMDRIEAAAINAHAHGVRLPGFACFVTPPVATAGPGRSNSLHGTPAYGPA